MKGTHAVPSRMTRRDFVRCSALGLALAWPEALARTAGAAETRYPHNAHLTEAEISARIRQIHMTYSVGDTLSPEDSEFIDLYGTVPTTRATWPVVGDRTFGGHSYELRGNTSLTNTWGDEYTFSGTVQCGSAAITPSRITTYYSIMAYGLTGFSYDVVYQDTLSKYCTNTSWCTHEYYGKFFAVTSRQTITCWGDVSLPDGSSFGVYERDGQ